MNKKLCLFVAIAFIFVSIVSMYTQRGAISKIAIPRLETMTLMGIFPKTQKVDLGKMAKVSVALLGPKGTLSGISMRILATGNLEVVIEPSPKAVNAGWQVQIKKVAYDEKFKKTVMDLALVYTSAEGYAFSGNLPLTEISFIGKEVGEIALTFDATETMVLTKDNNKFPVSLSGGTISIVQ